MSLAEARDAPALGDPSTATSRPSAHETIPGLDVVRFFAACAVILHHYAYASWTDAFYPTGLKSAIGVSVAYPELLVASWWGRIGVEIFFIISGLVIALSAQGRTASQFARGRFLRLAPGLWFFATLAFTVTLIYAALPMPEILALYLKSMVLFPKGPWLDGVYWTLTIEVVFYTLIFALIACGAFHRLCALAIAWSAAVFVFWLLCLADSAVAFPGGVSAALATLRDAYISKPLLLTTGSHFALGVLLYYLSRPNGVTPARVAAAIAAVMSGLIALCVFPTERPILISRQSAELSVGLIYLTAVFAIAMSVFSAKWMTERLSKQWLSFVRGLGLSSYPIYLVHNISGAWIFGRILRTGLNKYAALALAIGICIGFSHFFVNAIEGPLKRWTQAKYDAIARFAALHWPRTSIKAEA